MRNPQNAINTASGGSYARLADGTITYLGTGSAYSSSTQPNSGSVYVPGLGANVSYDSQDMHQDLSHFAAAKLTNAFYSPEADMQSTIDMLSGSLFYGSKEAALAAVSGLIDSGIVHSYTTLPSYADGGMHSGGWAMVGEEGPELAFLPPARIYTAGQTGQMLGESSGNDQMAEVVYELKMLRDQVAELTSVSQQSASALNGLGQQPMLVEIAP